MTGRAGSARRLSPTTAERRDVNTHDLRTELLVRDGEVQALETLLAEARTENARLCAAILRAADVLNAVRTLDDAVRAPARALRELASGVVSD